MHLRDATLLKHPHTVKQYARTLRYLYMTQTVCVRLRVCSRYYVYTSGSLFCSSYVFYPGLVEASSMER